MIPQLIEAVHQDGMFAVKSKALYSLCKRYRYMLHRSWDDTKAGVAFIGLNPSTATEEVDDPTVRRCRRWAESWGYGHFWMLNLFAYRATDPKDMKAQDEPIGEFNDEVISWVLTETPEVVCCWGTHGIHGGRSDKFREMLDGLPSLPGCLAFGFCKNGEPKHPLYLKNDTTLVEYRF